MTEEQSRCLVEGCLSDSEQGARIAAGLLRLGKLGQCSEESLVIEAEDEDGRQAVARPLELLHRCSTPADDHEAYDRPAVEDDLLVEDYGAEEDAGLLHGLAPPWAPGSQVARVLMKARAQQCVVCMEDKEHTFVPPHKEEGLGSAVGGHRFCTDCWVEFLYHNSRQQRHGCALPLLACPLCRGGISVPDVWGVGFELPATWMEPADEARTGEAEVASSWCPTAAGVLGLWAEAPGAAAASAAASETASVGASSASSSSGGCSPAQRGAEVRLRADSSSMASCWHVFGCPVPAWQSGCLWRLREALGSPGMGQEPTDAEELVVQVA